MMSRRNLTPEDEFAEVLRERAAIYGVAPDDATVRLLQTYFLKVVAWNARLHLVAPCTPSEFATRHVLESLLAERFLAKGARVVDIGSGAGLPAIPLLIARPDIEAVLIEASAKKSVFLREALSAVGRQARARVVAERFERLPRPDAHALTCRALERFAETLPAMLEWAENVGTLLLFGGESLRERLEASGQAFYSILAPESERRFLFVVRREL
ncbi:MAG TPA: RsmG family class I SAM-dependent methyltransferase [Pyrinomonadaceae bacterium]|nr:RsmG family class I SAM-dependent methyltransferase [Pyrinomonadaceae bacterium]